MRVRLAYPRVVDGNCLRLPGDVVEVPVEEARSLLHDGLASEVEEVVVEAVKRVAARPQLPKSGREASDTGSKE